MIMRLYWLQLTQPCTIELRPLKDYAGQPLIFRPPGLTRRCVTEEVYNQAAVQGYILRQMLADYIPANATQGQINAAPARAAVKAPVAPAPMAKKVMRPVPVVVAPPVPVEAPAEPEILVPEPTAELPPGSEVVAQVPETFDPPAPEILADLAPTQDMPPQVPEASEAETEDEEEEGSSSPEPNDGAPADSSVTVRRRRRR